jgi:cell division septation protein DedD
MKPVNRLITRLLKKRSVCFSLALLLCILVYVYWTVNGSRTASSFAASVPVEVGNRVWLDSNRNGLQDAGEPGIKGVTVHLYSSKGEMIGSAITDADGKYHFTVSPDADYVIKLDNAADYSNGPLKGDQLTVANSDCEHVMDSRAVLPNSSSAIGAGNYPQVAVAHLASGKNENLFNVGFTQATGKAAEDTGKKLDSQWSRCKPFPPDGSKPTPTPGTQPVVTATPDKPTPTPKPTQESKKPTPTAEPKKPTAVPTTGPTKFPSLPPTGSNAAGL